MVLICISLRLSTISLRCIGISEIPMFKDHYNDLFFAVSVY